MDGTICPVPVRKLSHSKFNLLVFIKYKDLEDDISKQLSTSTQMDDSDG